MNAIAANGGFKGSLTGVSIGADVTSTQKIWHSLQAFGDIAFAYSFSNILIEIQVRKSIQSNALLLCSPQLDSSVSKQSYSESSGHDKGAAAVGVEGDAEGHPPERGDDHHLLHVVRVHGIRGVRRRGPG
jgi:hypothetical protein